MAPMPPPRDSTVTQASTAQAWGTAWPMARMVGPTISSGHMHPPNIPNTMPRAGPTAVACSADLKREPLSMPAPVADQRPRDDEGDGRDRVAPRHAEHECTDADDQQRLAQADAERRHRLAEDDRALAHRCRAHPVVHAEPARLDGDALPAKPLMNTNSTSMVGAL